MAAAAILNFNKSAILIQCDISMSSVYLHINLYNTFIGD